MDIVLRISFHFRFVIYSLNGLKNETIIERLVEKTKKTLHLQLERLDG